MFWTVGPRTRAKSAPRLGYTPNAIQPAVFRRADLGTLDLTMTHTPDRAGQNGAAEKGPVGRIRYGVAAFLFWGAAK